MAKLNLAVIFGSRSVEHEVSVVTALQVIQNIDKSKYNVIPIYIDKRGHWHTGKALLEIKNYQDETKLLSRLSQINLKNQEIQTSPISKTKIDVAFVAIHGTYGEDGTLQGLLEMAQIPYTGSGVTGSALGMDKIMQKDVFKNNGLPVVDYIWLNREDWEKNKKDIVANIEKNLKYPVFVKPANLGSSVAISKAKNLSELEDAINLARFYDRRIIVEQGLTDIVEINCSVLGYKTLEVSVCEQPIKSDKFLTYEDKYLKGGKTQGMASLSRLIPAPISEKLTKEIQEAAKAAFRVCDCAGVARIDFMLTNSGKFYISEINTLPGSIAFYLWEKSGYPFPKLIDKLVDLAFERFEDRKQTTYSISTNLLQSMGKGNKVAKN